MQVNHCKKSCRTNARQHFLILGLQLSSAIELLSAGLGLSLSRTGCFSRASAAAGKNYILNLQLDSLDHSLCIFQFAHLLI